MTKKQATKLIDKFITEKKNNCYYMHGKICVDTYKDELIDFIMEIYEDSV